MARASRDDGPALGRPATTSHDEIEAAAFRLFDERGFDGTTLEAIATEAGVGRRTLFRYFESKNDIPWGRFDESLAEFRRILDDTPGDVPLWQSVHTGVLRFNDFGAGAEQQHRNRMGLILTTPTLQAHSVLRYAQWREVIADHVAARTGHDVGSLLPITVGHVSLALALSAYDYWLAHPGTDLLAHLDEAMGDLRDHLA